VSRMQHFAHLRRYSATRRPRNVFEVGLKSFNISHINCATNRYEQLSFRSAVSADNDFVWCQNCDFGQLHTTGESQPIVRCLNCGFRSCYRHSILWHERLTCEEYDKMLEDPDGFQSAIEKDEEAAIASQRRQEEEDETFARRIMERERQVEQDRQRQRHEEQLQRARQQQEAEARRKRCHYRQSRRLRNLVLDAGGRLRRMMVVLT
jgi:hypothetical protein